MKRTARVLVLVLLLACLLTTVRADDTYISSMDVNVIVDRYGNADTTVTVTIEFSGSVDSVSLPVGTNASNISVSGGSFSKKATDGVVWLNLRHAQGTGGTRTYVISYRQKHAVTMNEDKTQTLDLELLCPYWNWRIDSLNFSVTFPKEISGTASFVSGYYGDNITVTSSMTGATVNGTVLSSLMDQESLHMTLDLPSGFCRILHRQGTLSGVTSTAMVILTFALALYWLLQLANPIAGISSRTAPPDGVGAWEFPYVQSSGRPELSLLVLEWANLGYLSVHVSDRGRVTLQKRMNMSSERRYHEQSIFNLLFENGDIARADTPSFRRLAEHASALSSEYWNPRLFRKDSGNPEFLHLGAALLMGINWVHCMDWIVPTWAVRVVFVIPMIVPGFIAGYEIQSSFQKWLRKEKQNLAPALIALALCCLMLFNSNGSTMPLLALVIQFSSALLTSRGGRRSDQGMKIIAQIRSFRNDLSSANTRQLQLRLADDPQYYYKMLPYAEVLGLGRHLSETLENVHLDRCQWYEDERADYITATEFYGAFVAALDCMRKGRRTLRARRRHRRGRL